MIVYMEKLKRLVDEYKHAGFRPLLTVRTHPQHSAARIISLHRRQKKRFAVVAGNHITHSTTVNYGLFATCPAGMRRYTLKSRSAGYAVQSAEK